MTAVLAAAGLLVGLAKGTLALPLRSPVIQALCGILTTACADSQAEVTATEGAQPEDNTVGQPGCVHWRDAAALACCNTWQVSVQHGQRTEHFAAVYRTIKLHIEREFCVTASSYVL